MAALRLALSREQKIVHLGTGSGSVMVCVLAKDPINFLRLLVVGYDEICWGDEYNSSPNQDLTSGVVVRSDHLFRRWVKTTFNVSIPATASKIVAYPGAKGRAGSEDQFNRWVAESAAYLSINTNVLPAGLVCLLVYGHLLRGIGN